MESPLEFRERRAFFLRSKFPPTRIDKGMDKGKEKVNEKDNESEKDRESEKDKGKEKESEELIIRTIQHHSEALERIQEMRKMIKSRDEGLHEALSKYTDGIDVGVDVQKLGTLNTLVSNMLEDCLVVPPGDGSRADEPPANEPRKISA